MAAATRRRRSARAYRKRRELSQPRRELSRLPHLHPDVIRAHQERELAAIGVNVYRDCMSRVTPRFVSGSAEERRYMERQALRCRHVAQAAINRHVAEQSRRAAGVPYEGRQYTAYPEAWRRGDNRRGRRR